MKKKHTRKSKTKNTGATVKKAKKPAATVAPAEGKAGPFRPGSAYQRAYEILAGHPGGLSRQELLKKFMAATGKDEKHARYDLSVVLSASESPTGPRHPCCREGFWIEKENDFLKLHADK